MLYLDISCFENIVDPGQLASEKICNVLQFAYNCKPENQLGKYWRGVTYAALKSS